MNFFKRKKQVETTEPSTEPASAMEQEQAEGIADAPAAERIEPDAAALQAESLPEQAAAPPEDASPSEPASDENPAAAEAATTVEEKTGFFSRLGFKRKKSAEASDISPDSVEEAGQSVDSSDTSSPDAAPITTEQAVMPAGDSAEVDTIPAEQPVVEAQAVETVDALAEGPASAVGKPAQADAPAVADSSASEGEKVGFFSRLRRGLGRTSGTLVQGLGNLFLGRKEIDADLFEELESRLLMADVGIDATLDIINRLTQRVSRKELTRPEALHGALREELLALLQPCEQPLEVDGHQPYVILMVGVNGVGKTTTIGKLAKHYIGSGRSVMLAAGDTFRAAAVEQLQVWGERNDVPVVAQHTGADSASVLFDALQAARARKIDVLIADTAGRLHNKDNLMEELKKVVRVMGKIDPSAPHEVMLVLDAGTGQNALAQAEHFQQWVGVSGITLTKLDGTAKGGIIFAIAKKLKLPIRFIGVGEAVEDLRPFEAEQFIEALFDVDNSSA